MPGAIKAGGSEKHATLIDPRDMAVQQTGGSHGERSSEEQQRGQKPKADKNQSKAAPSAYKLAQGREGQTVSPFTKK
jgi:hypothetical protein